MHTVCILSSELYTYDVHKNHIAQLFLEYTFDDLVLDGHQNTDTEYRFPIHLLMVTMTGDLGPGV